MFEKLEISRDFYPSDPRFGVGPSLIPIEVIRRLEKTGHSLLGTSHRQMPVRNLVKEIQDGIRNYFKLPPEYEVVLGNGGATFHWDMIGLGLVQKSSFHFVCGEFSDKWYRAHDNIPWVMAEKKQVPYGEGLNPTDQSGYDFLCCTLNETSTGVQLTELPDLSGRQTLLGVDATSGAGQIKIDFKKIDVYYLSPQKIFASEGGLYISILSPKAVERAEEIGNDRNRFIPESMKWRYAIENSRKNQTSNTPSIGTLFCLNEQLKLMNELGESTIIQEAQRKADLIYGWAEEKDYLRPFVKDPMLRSSSVATIDVDEKFSVPDLTRCLREKKIAVDIEGYRKLNRNQLRISLFHNVKYEDLEKLITIISLAIEKEM